MRQMRVRPARYVTASLIALPILCIACSRQEVDVKDSGDTKLAVKAPVAASETTPGADEDCKAEPKWLDQVLDNKAQLFKDPAPAKHPASDCPFYQAAWQVFLYATRPVPLNDGAGTKVPRFLASSDFFTIEEVFGETHLHNFPKKRDDAVVSLAVKSLQRANSSAVQNEPAVGAGVAQAKTSPCIDQNGNPLYYGIHFNGVMKDFFTMPIAAKPSVNLLTAAAFQAAQQEPEFSTTLEFPPGSIELKSAWQIVDESHPPEGYFVVKASLPVLKIHTDTTTHQTSLIVDPTKPAQVRLVALLAIHVVFTLQDHPEFVWSTFQHVDKLGNPDTAPSALHNPDIGSAGFGPGSQFALFKAGTQIADANKLVTSADISTHFDETKQSFTKTSDTFQTSIYRVYRNSLADDTKPIDPDVQAVNDSMASIFKSSAFNPSSDHRDRFRLVGAVWMDDPCGTGDPSKKLKPNMQISNRQSSGPDLDPDNPKAIVAGEDRLSSTAMESFSQFDNPSDPLSFPNCFSCHDTQHIHDGNAKIKPSMINVSHVLSRYLVDAPSPSPPPPQP